MAITPGGRPGDASPLGGGKRRVLDDYVREVAHALMRKGFSKGHAIATAKNSLKRWSAGGGKVRPQVRAGAAAHLGVQKGLDSRGGHSLSGSMGGMPVDLAVTAPVVSSQDGPRAVVLAELKKRKVKTARVKRDLSADERQAIIDLVGAKGYSHGWIRAGGGVDASKLTPGANVRHTRNGDAYHSGTVISNHEDHAVIATKHKSGEYTGKTMKVKHADIHGPGHGSKADPAESLAAARAATGQAAAPAGRFAKHSDGTLKNALGLAQYSQHRAEIKAELAKRGLKFADGRGWVKG